LRGKRKVRPRGTMGAQPSTRNRRKKEFGRRGRKKRSSAVQPPEGTEGTEKLLVLVG